MVRALTGFPRHRRHWKVTVCFFHVIIVFVFILVVYSSFVIGLVCKLIFSFLFLAEDCFQETVEAMSHLGIKSDKQAEIFRVRF